MRSRHISTLPTPLYGIWHTYTSHYYHWVQLILQAIIIAQMLSIGGETVDYSSHLLINIDNICKYFNN